MATLFEKGVLSKDEFEAEKAHLLERYRNAEDTPANVRKWHTSKKGRIAAGVLVVLAAGSFVGALVRQNIKQPEGRLSERATKNRAGSPATSSPRLGFTNIEQCEPDVQFGELLQDLRKAGSNGQQGSGELFLAGSAEPIEVRSSITDAEPYLQIDAVPIRSKWNGLNVNEVRSISWATGNGFQINFAERPHQLTSILSRLGLVGVRTGKFMSKNGRAVIVEEFSRGSSWTCLWPIQNAGAGVKESKGDD